VNDPPASPLVDRLRQACAAEWAAFTRHPFVLGIGSGSLHAAAFRHYLVQDYLFLIHFARAYGLAAFKGETLADIRAAAAGLSAIIDREMRLHVAYCASWGLDEGAMAAVPEANATIAYTRFVLERGLAGDLLDLQTALAPCIIGYAEIGRMLAADPETRLDGNPYRAWIDSRFEALCLLFSQATRLEAAFWEMGLHPPEGNRAPGLGPRSAA
jgi:thiaminase/transcriptional activator TenA